MRRALPALALAAGLAAAIAAAPAGALPGVEPDPRERLAAPVDELVAAGPIVAGTAIERYRQRAGDLPVLGAEAVIADPPGAEPLVVADHTVARIPRPAPARLPRGAAIRRAKAATATERLRGTVRARLAVDRDGSTVWEVLVPALEPLGDFVVVVDARTGEVVRADDVLRHATGAARVFDPNPVVTRGGRAGLRDNEDRNSRRLEGQLRPVVLERLLGTEGCLRGTYVRTRLGRGKRAREACAAGFDFTTLTRASNRFEAVMAYFHIDRARAHVESLELSEPLRAKPQVVLVNSLREDNSYYSPVSRKIGLGTGGVDDGEDGDVIVHEYGHSLQDQAVPFFGQRFEGAAMGEGFGDYLAAMLSATATGGDPLFDPCMFEWDATSYTDARCARSVTRPLTKRQGVRRCAGSPHCLGAAWSGALYELRGLLDFDAEGRVVMDRVVLESHFMLTRRSNFADGARALVAADRLLYGGAHGAAIEQKMIARGFCAKRGC